MRSYLKILARFESSYTDFVVADFLIPDLADRPHASGGFVICLANTRKLGPSGCNVDQYPDRVSKGLCWMMVWLTRIFTPHSRLFFGWRMVLAGSFAFNARSSCQLKIAAVTLVVCVGKLQQPFTAHGLYAFRFGVTNARIRIQSGFSCCKCLEEVSPKCAFVGFGHLVKSWAESTHAPGDLRRKHFGRQRILDDPVPSRIPGRPAEFDLFQVDGGRRDWLNGLRMQRSDDSHAQCETRE